MEYYNMTLQRRVADVFNTPGISKIDFYFEDIHITSNGLREVGEAIRTRRIKVEIDPGKEGSKIAAAYTAGTDTLSIPSSEINNAFDRSQIVHEGTHALMDMYQYKQLTAANDEIIGYVTDAIYLAAEGAAYDFRRINSPDKNILFNAFILVRLKKMAVKKGVKLTFADTEKIRHSIFTSEAYGNIPQDTMTHVNGIRASKTADEHELEADWEYLMKDAHGINHQHHYMQINGQKRYFNPRDQYFW